MLVSVCADFDFSKNERLCCRAFVYIRRVERDLDSRLFSGRFNERSSLLCSSLGTFFTNSLVLGATGFSLLRDKLVAGTLVLFLVDILNENSFVLEDVSLGFEIAFVVKVLIDLVLLSVFLEQAAENSLAAHPKHFSGHTSITGTSALTNTGVSSLSLGGEPLSNAGTRVDGGRLLQNKTISDEFANIVSC